MSYSTDHLRTAGKITVYSTLVGVAAFVVIFIFNVGVYEVQEADAVNIASTSVTVLNTPPAWTIDANERDGSTTTTPTNQGEDVEWLATATDSNGEPYYLLICSNAASPTPNSGAAPDCHATAVQWAVSTSTDSGEIAYAATTTLASTSPFAGESFPWFAWVCDDNAGTPRCVDTYRQGSGTTSSPFEVNHPPTFSLYSDDSPADPGDTVTFYATSSDPDSSGGQDTVTLIVCNQTGFSTTTNNCDPGSSIATSTASASNPTATYTITIPTQDDSYVAVGYIIDNHDLEATGAAQGTDAILRVRNVAPTTSPATISLNGGSNMVLTVEQGETASMTIQYTVADNNSCINATGTDEIVGYELSVYRSGISSTTCSVLAGAYDPNNCYPSGLASTTWNLSCTASSTSCSGASDTTQIWDCTFPLWYVADPTDGTATSTQYNTENWLAQVQAIDDDNATGTLSEDADGVEVTSFLAFALNTLSIPYGSLEPGEQTDPIVATTTIAATGNVGLDKTASGTSMCTTFNGSTPCPNSATSTIPASEQVFSPTSSASYASATALSSTTPQEIEINVPKTTVTTTPSTSSAYWGIAVPGSITFSGSYTGENTFFGVVGESSDW